MKKRARGGILVLLLILILTWMALMGVVLALARGVYVQASAQNIADAALLSGLTIKAQALETIAARWEKWGQLLGTADETGVLVADENLSDVVEAAADLRRALSGYQTRARSMITVVTEANHVLRARLSLSEVEGLNLQLVAQPLRLIASSGISEDLAAGWYARAWEAQQRVAAVGLELSAAPWQVEERSRGRVIWDIDPRHPDVLSWGNGGFARAWADALRAGRLDPHRFPFFSAALLPSGAPE